MVWHVYCTSIPDMTFAVYLRIWPAASNSAYSSYIKTSWQRYWARILILDQFGLVCSHSECCVEDVGGTSKHPAGWHSQTHDMGIHKMFSHFIVAFRALPHLAQETCMT